MENLVAGHIAKHLLFENMRQKPVGIAAEHSKAARIEHGFPLPSGLREPFTLLPDPLGRDRPTA